MSGSPGRGTGPRPHTWLSGPDPVRHEQYQGWLKAKAQAQYRQEAWSITFEQWVKLWADAWSRRGRERHCIMLKRKSLEQGWTTANAHLVERIRNKRKGKDDATKV